MSNHRSTQSHRHYEEINDILNVMKKKEETEYAKKDYLSGLNQFSVSDLEVVNEVCREKISSWFFEVIEFCKFTSETALLAISFLDRFLATEYGGYALFDRSDYQLAAMCCLQLAVNLHEPMKLEMKLLSDLSRGSYTIPELKNTEMNILSALKWKLSDPTPSAFRNYYLELLPRNTPVLVKEKIYKLSQIQIVEASKNYKLITCKPSIIALSSIYNAIDIFHSNNEYTKFKRSFDLNISSTGDNSKIFICDVQKILLVYVENSPKTNTSEKAISHKINTHKTKVNGHHSSPISVYNA